MKLKFTGMTLKVKEGRKAGSPVSQVKEMDVDSLEPVFSPFDSVKSIIQFKAADPDPDSPVKEIMFGSFLDGDGNQVQIYELDAACKEEFKLKVASMFPGASRFPGDRGGRA